MKKLLGIAKSVAIRAAGVHLAQNHLNSHGKGTLQSLVEGYALRAIVAGATILYHNHPTAQTAIDTLINIVTGQ